VHERLLAALAQMSAKKGGLQGLARALRLAAAATGSPELSPAGFAKALRDFGLGLSDAEVAALFAHYDPSRSGFVGHAEFMRGLAGDMPEARRALVLKAFAKIDRHGRGVVSLADLASAFSARQHPLVLNGARTERQVAEEFLGMLDSSHGSVTLQDFLDYYACFSASTRDDSFFGLSLWNAWGN
jgi:Ca2+-binding EF-hand superfamily protein